MQMLCTTPRCSVTAELCRCVPVLDGLQWSVTAELAAATKREQLQYTNSDTVLNSVTVLSRRKIRYGDMALHRTELQSRSSFVMVIDPLHGAHSAFEQACKLAEAEQGRCRSC